MLYPNPEFLLLLAGTLAVYFLCASARGRARTLVVASLCFYAWSGWLDTLIFLFVVLLCWLAVWAAKRFPGRKRVLLRTGVVLLTLHLFVWKYLSWAVSQIQVIHPRFLQGHHLDLPLPVGISFFTLQGIAYLIDFGRSEAEYLPFTRFLLFKSFFGQLVAGPIVRARQFAPQLRRLRDLSSDHLNRGMAIFLLGYAKKTLIADPLSRFVDPVFQDPRHYSSLALFSALLFYTVQIWGDFSGYTDMGRGAARMFGLSLPENFRAPYFATSPRDFWRRWHITLGEWIRDYLYIPLGGSRGSRVRAAAVLVLTMLLSGLWHGANWTFALWGLYHGALLTLDHQTRTLRARLFAGRSPHLRQRLGGVFTFAGVTLGWLLFRSDNLSNFAYSLTAMLSGRGGEAAPSNPLPYGLFLGGMTLQYLGFSLETSSGKSLLRHLQKRAIGWRESLILSAEGWVWVTALLGLLWMTLSNALPVHTQPFIYFRF